MKDIKFKEQISDYKILKKSEIIIFNNSEVTIEIDIEGEDALILIIKFKDNKEIKGCNVDRKIDGRTMVLTFENLQEPNSTFGFFEPMQLATSDSGDALYFNCIIITYNDTEGNRLIKYSFLTKDK